MTWIEKIENLMKQKNWTQKDLARESGITEASVSRYLNGERTPRTDIIVNFAKVFNVSTDYLLFDEKPDDDAYNNIVVAIARNGGNLTADEKNRLISLILSTSGDENVQKP